MKSLRNHSRGLVTPSKVAPFAVATGLMALLSYASLAGKRGNAPEGRVNAAGEQMPATTVTTPRSAEGSQPAPGPRPSWGWDGTAWW